MEGQQSYYDYNGMYPLPFPISHFPFTIHHSPLTFRGHLFLSKTRALTAMLICNDARQGG